jgi:diaminopimelate epimerase
VTATDTRLTKHHGLGNEFVVVDATELSEARPWEALAKEWCDRRTGVGADGLLVMTVDADDPDHLTMVLFNADGSRAEMSGNGIRCLAQAAYRSQRRDGEVAYRVETDAGTRTVEVVPTSDPATIVASVDMGRVVRIAEPANWASLGCDPMRPVMHLGLGNPHAVVGVEDVAVVDLATLGAKVPSVNLEIVEPGPESNAVTMRVHERGAGITQACGTGACASAFAALQWGIVPASSPEIVVHMDGGDATVRVGSPHGGEADVVLVGPATFVAEIEV